MLDSHIKSGVLPKSLIYPAGPLPTTQNYAALGVFFSLWVHLVGILGREKVSRTRIVIKNIFCPFHIYWGAGWGGLQQENSDDMFYL